MAIKLKIKLLGVFRGISGKNQLYLDFEKDDVSIQKMVKRLVTLFSPEFKRVLVDPELDNPGPNAIILVNGQEIGLLNGVKTKVKDGDEIVLIPVSHGG
ncbi:MoaD/ThiS family protein [Candidatus Bathyarchaeota archaeon]|nr:MoaD/ThiS family protein [Candidatus Bathyarchaeota archaeon]